MTKSKTSLATRYFYIMDEFERFTTHVRSQIGSRAFVSVEKEKCELHIENVAEDTRLDADIQKFIFENGFNKVTLFHEDVDDKGEWETHYTLSDILPTRGWRRRWVSDDTVKTTRSLAPSDKPDFGYFEISEWPESWRHHGWLDTGYMRIVPDTLTEKTS